MHPTPLQILSPSVNNAIKGMSMRCMFKSATVHGAPKPVHRIPHDTSLHPTWEEWMGEGEGRRDVSAQVQEEVEWYKKVDNWRGGPSPHLGEQHG